MVETKRNQIKIILTSFNYQRIHNSVVYTTNLFKNEAKDERIVLYNFANMIYDDYIKDYLKITISYQMAMIRYYNYVIYYLIGSLIFLGYEFDVKCCRKNQYH